MVRCLISNVIALSVAVVFLVRNKTTHFESKDCASHKSCIEVAEVLQACGAQCRKIYSEGKLQLVTHLELFCKVSASGRSAILH